MIVGIKFSSIVSVTLDRFGKMEVDGERVGIKEVPYVRYNFMEYTEDVLEFIRGMKKVFPHSVHIADVRLDSNADANITSLELSDIENLCVFGMYSLTDETKDNYQKVVEDLRLVRKLKSLERVIVCDDTSYLYTDSFKAIEKLVYKELQIRGLGLCGSPITNSNNCCISAEYSRKLAAKYGDDDTANVVATHQSNCEGCWCVRHVEIDSNIVPKKNMASKGASGKEKEPKEGKGAKKSSKPKLSSVPDCWF